MGFGNISLGNRHRLITIVSTTAYLLPSFLLSSSSLFGASFGGKLATSFGRDLSPETPSTSVSLEPDLGVTFGKTRVGLYSLFDRPTDPFEKMTVPKTILSVKHDFAASDFTLSPALSTNLIALDRWGIDGYQVRETASVIGKISPGPWTFMLRAGAFGIASKYTILADGRAATRYGFVQRADVEYKYKRLVLQALISTVQRFNGVWANDYATSESVGYEFSDTGTIAIQHELLSSVIDASTGFNRPLRIADNRDSRLSLVLELGL